ncbi:MAG: cyclic nucleotide-binding domain-containing protein [Desulfobacterales bacterium]|nr:MAG: cyclic nucleotide-binding domain-containing protein [Desulfobacterales bacterium]
MATVSELKKASLFESLSDDELEAIIQLGQEESFEPHENIFNHGQKAKTLYVLLDGSVSLRIKAEVGIDLMAETMEKKGSVVGTPALVKPYIHNVTAKCTKSTKVLAIDAVGLRKIMRRHPSIGFEVMTQLARLYFSRLNSTRMAITNLFKIFKLQTDKSKVFDTYGELE